MLYFDQKAAEVVESEQGMFKKYMTRCVDNLQVSIQNLHIRFESNNPSFSKDLFSMGFTLQHLKLCTTNSSWEAQFMDRTAATEANKPLYKILDIKNFGFYYKPNDTIFISELESEELRLEQMIGLFSEGKPRIISYSDSYLLEPLQLVMQLKLEAGHQ